MTDQADSVDGRELIVSGLPPKVEYAALSAKQKEIYNFQKVAALLAEHGYNCIKLADDWQGADFLAYHMDGQHTLKVQLKARITIAQKYVGKDLHIVFRAHDHWYIIDHDALVELCGQYTNWLSTPSWATEGYSAVNPSKSLTAALTAFRLT